MIPREFFPDHELACHCGCGLLPKVEDTELLYIVRLKVRKPMPISSAARCKKHNSKAAADGGAGGKSGSIHLPPNQRVGASADWGGQGWDIIANKHFQMQICDAARWAGFTGFGFSKHFIHIDNGHPELTYWTY